MAKSVHKLSDDDYRALGKAVEQIIKKDYIDLALHWRRLFGVSLVRGVAVGFGTVLGATLLVGLLIWLLSAFDSLPFVGRLFENLRDAIDN